MKRWRRFEVVSVVPHVGVCHEAWKRTERAAIRECQVGNMIGSGFIRYYYRPAVSGVAGNPEATR